LSSKEKAIDQLVAILRRPEGEFYDALGWEQRQRLHALAPTNRTGEKDNLMRSVASGFPTYQQSASNRSSAQRSSNRAYQMRWAQPLRAPLLIFKHRANARGAAILSRIGAQS